MTKEVDSVSAVLADINKRFGKNSVIMLGEDPIDKIECWSTGSLQLDKILGGGFAKGRVTEVFGVEGAGKTTLCLQVVASVQKAGSEAAYIDVENALDLNYAKVLGVDIKRLVLAQPESAEQALNIAEALARSGKFGIIVVDSVAALAPQAELDGEMGDQTIGLQARLMGKALRKLAPVMNQTNCNLTFINQIRANIGMFVGAPETTTGGKALKYAASQRIDLRKGLPEKQGTDIIGNKVKIKVVKNKIAIPMQTVTLPLIFGHGFDGGTEVVDLAVDYDIIKKSGAWFETHDETRLQGKPNVVAYYNEHPDLYNQLRELVQAKLQNSEIKQEFDVDPETGEIIEDE